MAVGSVIAGVAKGKRFALGETLDKIINTTASVGRGVFKGAATVADEILNTAGKLRPLVVKPADNALGFAYRRWVTPTVLAGAIGAGLLVGANRASVGLVQVGDIESLTGETRTPNLRKKQVEASFIDHFGADGELALALHTLRNG